jgi:2-(1,2-epoxy-1,2-dihydrophenyl)acetyl-CoA isomerase
MNLIQTTQDQNVLIITLNRPEKYNSFVRPMALGLIDAINNAASNDEVRCIVITGKGKAFCAGQDLGEVMDENGPGLERIVKEHYNQIIKAIRGVEKPVIALVNGVAAGAGANIAIACDLCIAKESASFIQAFSKIGLIPDSGGTWFLPRLIGMQRATALAMLGTKVMAKEAEEMGMIYKSFPDEVAEEETLKVAHILSNMPTQALGYTKRAFNQGASNSLDEQLELEGKLQTASGQSHDYQEGVSAFLEKRPAKFTGK